MNKNVNKSQWCIRTLSFSRSGYTLAAHGYVYNKVYQQYSTVGGNRVCPAAARLWVKSMGKGQRGFPKRHQLDLLQELFSHLSFLSRFLDSSLLVTSIC